MASPKAPTRFAIGTRRAGMISAAGPRSSRKGADQMTRNMKASLEVEELEQRIAPSVIGTGGYDGQPGKQADHVGNPSGSATPENKAG